jgi:hypothetical protein
MTCPSFEHNLAIYLMMVTATVIRLLLVSKNEDNGIPFTVYHMIDIGQVAHLTLSLLTNIFATSIIALKTWCVRVYGGFGKYFVVCLD